MRAPASSPLELRVGSTGAGLFVGCGAGLGVVTPVSLHSIPLLGQLAASLAASLGSVNHATGGLFIAARGRVRALGVRNLDLGVGCGVLVGYGYGAGLFLKPTALQSLAASMQAAGQQVVAKLPQPVQTALREQQQQRQQQLSGRGAVGTSGSVGGAWGDPALLGGGGDGDGGGGMFAGASSSMAAAQSQQPTAVPPQQQKQQPGNPPGSSQHPGQRAGNGTAAAGAPADDVAELTRLVLRQQNQLGELQQRVDVLQATVCRLDAGAPGCKR